MRKLFLLLLLFGSDHLLAQHTAIDASFNSGLFRYKNVNVGYISQVNVGLGTAYTNNPTSDKPGTSYGFSIAVQRTTRYHLVFGLDAGVEALQTRQSINRTYGPFPYDYRNATGTTTFTKSFVNFFPYLGYAQPLGKQWKVEVKAGFEYAAGMNGKDKGSVTILANDSSFKVNRKIIKSDNNFDIRFRFQGEVWYRHFGLYAGYSRGSVNYFNGYIGANFEAYARYTRLGLHYRFKK